MDDRTEKLAKERVESELKLKGIGNIDNFCFYHDGFSFTVATELEAYKSAYVYRHCDDVIVRPTVLPTKDWSVHIYTKGGRK